MLFNHQVDLILICYSSTLTQIKLSRSCVFQYQNLNNLDIQQNLNTFKDDQKIRLKLKNRHFRNDETILPDAVPGHLRLGARGAAVDVRRRRYQRTGI